MGVHNPGRGEEVGRGAAMKRRISGGQVAVIKRRRPVSAAVFGLTAEGTQRRREPHHAAVATVVSLHQPLHQLALLERGAVVEAEGLHSVSQNAARVDVQDVGPVLLVHGHHLTLHALRARHRLPEAPGPAVVIAVEAEGVWGGLAQLSEALFAFNVVGVGGNQQTAGLELDAVTWAQSKGGPFCKQTREELTSQAR